MCDGENRTRLATLFLVLFVGCGPTSQDASRSPSAPTLPASKDAIIIQLSQGKVLEQVVATHHRLQSASPEGKDPTSKLPIHLEFGASNPVDFETFIPTWRKEVRGACSGLVDSIASEKPLDALSGVLLGNCMAELSLPAERLQRAIYYFRFHTFEDDQKRKLSELPDEELEALVNRYDTVALGPRLEFKGWEPNRTRFTNEELDELRALIKKRDQAIDQASSELESLLNRHPTLKRIYSIPSSARYRAIFSLSGCRNTELNLEKIAQTFLRRNLYPATYAQWMETLPQFEPDAILRAAFYVLVPKYASAYQTISEINPIELLQRQIFLLSGPQKYIEGRIEEYQKVRDSQNRTPPASFVPHEKAVHVALIDTGLDYEKYPELGYFLGTPGAGTVRSYDFSDQDDQVFNPHLGVFSGHGSMTSAAFLSTFSHADEKIFQRKNLQENRLQMAMWKIGTARGFLSAPDFGESLDHVWLDKLFPLYTSVIQILNQKEKFPEIVSVSMVNQTYEWAKKMKDAEYLKRTPWLWVMAAGNTGEDISRKTLGSGCFADFPEASIPRDRILCVGAISKGSTQDQIAFYSNYGKRVDLFTYEWALNECPRGTSCATPAVAAVAALVKAQYPQLSPAQIRDSLLEAAEEKEMPVQRQDGDVRPVETKKVKFLDTVDPLVIQKVLQIAGKK